MKSTTSLKAKIFRQDGQKHSFCEISVSIDRYSLGNDGIRSVLGLVSSEIERLIQRIGILKKMSSERTLFFSNVDRRDIYDACYAWQWKGAIWPFEDKCPIGSCEKNIFWALPLATEIFDGERLYFFPIGFDSARLIWIDHTSNELVERTVSMDEYESAWTNLAKFIDNFVCNNSVGSEFVYP